MKEITEARDMFLRDGKMILAVVAPDLVLEADKGEDECIVYLKVKPQDSKGTGDTLHTGYSVLIHMAPCKILTMFRMQTGLLKTHFTIQTIDYDDGVRFYPDGSGQPPSQDVVGDLTTQMMDQAMSRLVGLYIEDTIKGILENNSMEKYAVEG